MNGEFCPIFRRTPRQTISVCRRPSPHLNQNSLIENCYAPKAMDFSMIFGEEEAAIPSYCNDDEPKNTEKTRFGRVRIIFSNLTIEQ